MAEHRRAGQRPTPRPDPLGAAPVPGPLPKPAPTRPEDAVRSTSRARMARRPQRWTHGLSRAFRTRQGRWALMALASAAVILIGLLGSGFLSSPTPAVPVPPIAGDVGISVAPVSVSPAKVSKTKGADAGIIADPVKALRNNFPDNPLNHLHGPGLHHVTVSAHAAGPMAVVGYLVPTGLGAAYGAVKNRTTWSLTQQALGRGYLAAIFVQTGKSGVPITCQIVVDGKVTNTETTSGQYGRAICLG